MANTLFHKRYQPNQHGRDFIIGDLHGEYDQLITALENVSFDPLTDRCFSVGDLIDRGPDSIKCAKLINAPWFHAVLGNHEQMMLNSLRDNDYGLWLFNGGQWINDTSQDEIVEIVKLLHNLPSAATIDHASGQYLGICHAQSPVADWSDIESVEGDSQAELQMLWARSRIDTQDTSPVQGVNWLFHGHTVLNQIAVLGNSVFIDTGACFGRKLTLLCLDDFVASRGEFIKQPSSNHDHLHNKQF